MTKISIAVLGVFALTVVASGPASAQVGPNLCTSKKLKASGKDAYKKLNCYAKVVKNGGSVDMSCLDAEDMNLATNFAAADGLGACVNGTGTTEIGPKVTNLVDDVRTPLVGMSTSASLCTSKKLKAAGKKAFKKANCWSKAVKKGADIDFGCLCGEDAKLSDAFTKAEGLGTCIGGTGDAGSIGGKVDAFVTDLVDELTSVSATTTSTVTTTTIPCSCGTPNPGKVSFQTLSGSGPCGNVLDDAGATLKTLDQSKLYTGGGGSALPPSVVPDYGQSLLNVSLCSGKALSLTNSTQVDTGSNRNCTSAGCLYGPPLPIPNGALSTCVINKVARDASGSARCDDGSAFINIPLTSELYLLGDILSKRCSGTTDPNDVGRRCSSNGDCPGGTCVDDSANIQPCPICNPSTLRCNGGTQDVPGMASVPCTPGEITSVGAEFPTSHDCDPPGPAKLGDLPIPYVLTTGTSSKTSADLSAQIHVFCGFCGQQFSPGFANPAVPCTSDADCANVCPPGGFPKCKQRNSGAFAVGAARTINETGSPAGAVMTNDPAAPSNLASVFCIVPTFNSAVDGSADLPGPGAACLAGQMQLLP